MLSSVVLPVLDADASILLPAACSAPLTAWPAWLASWPHSGCFARRCSLVFPCAHGFSLFAAVATYARGVSSADAATLTRCVLSAALATLALCAFFAIATLACGFFSTIFATPARGVFFAAITTYACSISSAAVATFARGFIFAAVATFAPGVLVARRQQQQQPFTAAYLCALVARRVLAPASRRPSVVVASPFVAFAAFNCNKSACNSRQQK